MGAAVVIRELVLGGQRSGKSRRAETIAAAWLETPAHKAVLIATAEAADADMRQRIEVHRRDRARMLPRVRTVEEPLHLAAAIRDASDARTLVVVDCMTLWLTNWLAPLEPVRAGDPDALETEISALLAALADVAGPVVLVSNEIGMGVVPLGRESRVFVDTLGRLNQRLAAACDRVTLMVAGVPLLLKAMP